MSAMLDRVGSANRDVAADDVRAQLARILASPGFRASRRLRSFLSFVVEEALAGRSADIKGYTLAVKVFGRSPSFDPGSDPIVRVVAGRLRDALDRYYLTDGKRDPLRIVVPKGSYAPRFEAARAANPTVWREGLPVLSLLPLEAVGPGEGRSLNALNSDLQIALAKSPLLRIVADRPADESGDQLTRLWRVRGVRFVLAGNVEAANGDMRVAVRLWDASVAELVWTDSFDQPTGSDPLAAHSAVVRRVAARVGDSVSGAVVRTEIREALESRTDSAPLEAVLLVQHYTATPGRGEYWAARKALERLVESDPENAWARASLGTLRVDGYAHGYSEEDRAVAIAEALREARHAISLDIRMAPLWWSFGVICIVNRDVNGAQRAAESLIALNPQASSLALAGWLLALIGEWERGVGMIRENIALLEKHVGWFHHALFLDRYRVGHYEAALEEAYALNTPQLVWDGIERAAALAQLGREELAQGALREAFDVRPDLAADPRRILDCFIVQDELVDHLLDGLYKAGLGR